MSLPKLDIPTYELTLPSTGKKVKFRPFLVKEHKVLLTMVNADNEEILRIVKELIDACTFNKLDVNELPHFDVEYVFMNLRAKSIGESVDVIVNCDCGNKIETSFDIENMKVEKPDNHTNKIMLTDNIGVQMRYPVFDEVVGIFQTNDQSKIFDMVADCIDGVFDNENYWNAKEQTKDEIKDFLFSLTKDQFAHIEKFFETSPKVVQNIECDCPQCGKHNSTRLEGLSNFFV